MFYSETLLAKNGPLARVWLASNLERKLSKQNVLSEKLETKVKDIIGTGQAPMALRMSGQLLLGVVRIYSRKARYLLDDCNEALAKIKFAFRPGNVDLPAHQSHAANPNTLVLPDTITELDLFAPLPDPEDLLREPEERGPGRDPTLLDFGASQLLPDSQTPAAKETRNFLYDDDDLGLDIGLGPNDTGLVDRSIEVGRRAQTPRRDATLFDDDDLGLDLGLGDTTIGRDSTVRPTPGPDGGLMLGADDDDVPMGGMEDDIENANAMALKRAGLEKEQRQRDDSPLSTLGSEAGRDLERTFNPEDTTLDDDPTMVQAAQRVKRRKVMDLDNETELQNSQIKRQQEDTSAITRATSFLPRDPLLLQLMEMQRNGSFVSNIMGEGRMQGWAPELRGILSMEIVRKDKKRKRDSGVADVGSDVERQATPQLEIPQDDDEGYQVGGEDDVNGGLQFDEEDGALDASIGHPFDTTEAPLLHPSQSGPVSLGTKNAVHLLREHFAPDHATASTEPPTPSKRVKSEALFTDLCPEAQTSRQDATKMFFELLVLGTKDAIKVEQDSKKLGGPIRVRGKRGLWGDWAATNAGGEIAEQEEEDAQAVVAAA